VVVLRVLCDVAELPRDADPVGHLSTLVVREEVDLLLELLVALRREDDFLHCEPPDPLLKKKRGAGRAPSRARMVPPSTGVVKGLKPPIWTDFAGSARRGRYPSRPRAGRPPRVLVHRPRRDPDAA